MIPFIQNSGTGETIAKKTDLSASGAGSGVRGNLRGNGIVLYFMVVMVCVCIC